MLSACGADDPDEGPATEDAPTETEPDTDDQQVDEPDEDDEPDEPEVDPAEAAAEVEADELGQIPVIMYHRLLESGGSEYDNTHEEFRQELTDLHEDGYRFITTHELVSGEIDVPAGTTPAVLTFDDSTAEQFAMTDGEVDPETAVGIMLDLADELEGFRATGSFYVLGSLFGVGPEEGEELLRELHELGFEIGNHTFGHSNLSNLDAAGVQRELALGQQLITDAVDGAEVTTLSLPFGINPEDKSLLPSGSHEDLEYTHDGVLLVGSNPAVSPFHAEFDPMAIPRIRSQPQWSEGDEVDFGSGYWLSVLADDPDRRYVSDGDPDTIAIPADREDELADDVDPDRVVTY